MKLSSVKLSFSTLSAIGIAAICSTLPTAAFAHQVQTNYVLDAQTRSNLQVQAVFSNGEPLKGANVTIYSPEQPNRPWAKGLTDSEGRYTFDPDESVSGNWEIDIERAGHGDILVVPVSEAGIIDANQVSQGHNRDVHYAGSPLMAVGSVAITATVISFGYFTRKRTV
jgi:nickel transport protein